jgi:hypothetical protein
MATTPNYGWVTPAPTDFVTDLPADFETFADAVDADLAGLLGGTTGQVLTKDSASDHDFSWAAPAAGGMTQIATGSLSGASVTLSAIPGTYKNLQLIVKDFKNATGSDNFWILVNGSSSSVYASVQFTATSIATAATASEIYAGRYNGAATPANFLICDFYDYANTTTHKVGFAQSWDYNGSSSGDMYGRFWAFRDTSAITSLELKFQTYNFSGGSYTLYGVS